MKELFPRFAHLLMRRVSAVVETKLMRRKAPVTMALLVVIAIVFAFEVLTRAYDSDADDGGRWARSCPDLVQRGEYWRLITAMFLHGELAALAANSWALYQLGTLYEVLFGSKRFAMIYFATGIVACIASSHRTTHGPVRRRQRRDLRHPRRVHFLDPPLAALSPSAMDARPDRQLVFWIVVNIAIGYRCRSSTTSRTSAA